MSENRLAQETSLYLRQHKENPVNWWPWGPEALAAAKAENKPILLSVGYAACHWCHVMAHESFEDDDTAKLINSEFIAIKVDREERPDVDAMCMDALRVMGQSQGWPVTLFLSPEGVPFFGGTYFPKAAGQNMPSFSDVLIRVATVFKEQPHEITNHAEAITAALKAAMAHDGSGEMSFDIIEDIMLKIGPMADRVQGGFGGGPKFPQTMLLDFLWRNGLRTADTNRQHFVVRSLKQMSRGGIYDHLGGGYARYTTDSNWMVPHFEKMLYDNALIVATLTEVWKKTNEPLFAQRVEETIGWALREMQHGEGGFAASLDADSEGVEGKFYIWDEDQVDAVLGDGEDATLFKLTYAVGPGGNFDGKTILNQLYQQPEMTPQNMASLASSRAKLFDAREKRVRPARDDKVLADWNGLMIAALAEAAMTFERPEWLDAAKSAYRFIIKTMNDDDRLRHVGKHAGVATDYANMIGAALTLYEATADHAYLEQASAWEKVLADHFLDQERGSYYYTADDGEQLAVRIRGVLDESTPSANGTMLTHLTRLWLLTGNETYRGRAEALLRAFGTEATDNPLSFGSYLASAEFYFAPVQIAVIGRQGQAGTQELVHETFRAPTATRILQIIEPGQELPEHHPAFGKKQEGHKPTAYVCVGATCSKPVTSRKSLGHLLAAPATTV